MTEQATTQIPDDQRPLVTFALFAYNQEKYIREAVLGALAQTYSPLQIILSDDCSPDRTFAVMQEMVADYSGPHEIILNRNEWNLGIGAHVNKIMGLSSGKYVVVAAGDDISLNCRVQKVVDYWLRSGRVCNLIYSNADVVDKNGNFIKTIGHEPRLENYGLLKALSREFPSPIGCANAWHPDVFEVFGPLRDDIVAEDRIVSMRAFFLGGYGYIDESLVKYRVHENNVYNRQKHKFNYLAHLERSKKVESIHCKTFEQFSIDIDNDIVKSKIDAATYEKAKNLISKKIKSHTLQILMLYSKLSQRLKALLLALMPPVLPVHFFRYVLRILVPRLHKKIIQKNWAT